MPFLIPLLLLTLFSLTFSHTLHLLNSPLAHTRITPCLTPGTSTHTRVLRCSSTCLLHLHRNLNSTIHTSFTLTSPTLSTTFTFPDAPHTQPLTLQNGTFHLSVRSHNPHSSHVCGLLTYAFQRQFASCPIVLPTVLAPSPSPSPSPSPTSSPTPSPQPSPARNSPSSDASNASNASNTTSASEATNTRQVTPRIVGGNTPDASLRTHMAAFIKEGAFVCSGSVISPLWALTAAHCRIERGDTVSIGGGTVTSGEFVSVQAAFGHPGFDFSRTDSPNDIALILFDRPAPEGTTFIRVNTNASDPVPGAYARVAGYGETFRRSVTTLRQVDIPVVSMPKCRSDYSRANPGIARRLNEELQLCAGLNEGGCDACQGDSGGPLALFDSAGHLVQVGIVSFGIGCARAGFPGVHTRLSHFEPWLREIGAGFIRSTDGVTVFSTGSAEAAGLGGFSIAGLSTLQSILVLVGIAAVAGVLLFLAGLGFVRKVRRSRTTPTMPQTPPQGPPPRPPQYLDNGGFGGYDPTTEQGLYPVYGAEYQYDGYPAAQPQPPPPPPTQPPPIYPQSLQHQPVQNVVQGGGAAPVSGGNMNDNLAPDNRPTTSSLYPQNTVFNTY